MTLEEYTSKNSYTNPKEYANCVLHESDWPAIRAWAQANGHTFLLRYDLFSDGPCNMLRLHSHMDCSSVCNGEPSDADMVRCAREIYDGKEGYRDPLFFNPYVLGIVPKSAPIVRHAPLQDLDF